jgi:hypothetical protein
LTVIREAPRSHAAGADAQIGDEEWCRGIAGEMEIRIAEAPEGPRRC